MDRRQVVEKSILKSCDKGTHDDTGLPDLAALLG